MPVLLSAAAPQSHGVLHGGREGEEAEVTGWLFLVGLQVVDVEDTQLDGPHHEPCGVDARASVALGEEFLHQLVLPLLQALHAEGHATQIGDLLLGVAKGEVAQKTFVVFVNLIVDQCFLSLQRSVDALLEAFHDALEDGLVERA